MDIGIQVTLRRQDDPGAYLAFYHDTLGFGDRAEAGSGPMGWIAAGPAGQGVAPISGLPVHR